MTATVPTAWLAPPFIEAFLWIALSESAPIQSPAVQAADAIVYSRGVIKNLDRAALMRMSCERYQTLLDQSAALP
jgi:hypothetical protein